MRKNANSCASAGTIDGNCNELLSITGSPDAEIIVQPSSGKTSIKAYSNTCEALAAIACQPGKSAGSGGCVVENRTTSRTITSSKIATPKGLCRLISHSCRSDTEATMPAPINSMAMIISAISQCSRRASGAKWFG
ncbi:hypothetical protein D3C72_1353670 [compost metagenome]